MKNKRLLALIVFAIASVYIMFPIVNADTLAKEDFQLESFSKTVDFMDYARAYADLNGLQPPPSDYHAYLYMNYINTSGLQLFYAGLDNITFGQLDNVTFTTPLQSFIMHYKTSNNTRDALLASTFLMLLAFNESSSSIYPNSPDRNDTLWASFSMGLDLSSLGADLPALNSKTETIPLTHSADMLQWSWGMTYTNLTAMWWRTWIDPNDPHYDNGLAAITVYDELTFTYNLTINPTDHTATLTENHIIGRIRNLFLHVGPLLWVKYNSTGSYVLGSYLSNETVYDFIENNGIKMSIVDYQSSVVADHETYSETANGQNVTDTETQVANTTVSTYTDDGEKISDANFGVKDTYKLFNYTADPTEQTYTINQATARTASAAGFAGDTDLFKYQIGLMKFLPLVVAHMDPGLYTRAEETLTNMTRADYFYIVGYGNYSGYRIEQDPTLTIYLSTPTTGASTPPNIGGIIIVGTIVVIIAVAAAITLRQRKPKTIIEPPAQQPQN
jgi:hypothetical protein